VRHAQKLESLGVLAGGVAHDFNNILTVIANSVALAKTGQNVDAHLDGIAVAASRAAELCRQMLSYAGKTAFVLGAVDVSTLVNEMLSMLDVSVGKKAVLVRDLAPNLPMVRGDATQIRQVVLNLVLNAAEAIVRPEGKVVVATGMGTYGPGAFAFATESGPYVFIEVRDNGAGMDAATAAQMFDPFFTTKFVGRGLGMATVLGIVRGHGGAIEVDSEPGKGTQVRVFFPTERVATRSSVPSAGPEVERGRGVVLVVDDEKGVRVTTRLLLEQLGFEALVASDGLEALDVLRANPRIDVVLLDLTMPRLDGIQTMKAMREIAPQIPIVLTSGHGQVPESIAQPNALLAKPYTVPELLATLRRVMPR
jgi:CheY-like chemotaxis protein